MAQNHVQKGAVMPWTNGTGAAVSSGDPVAVGDMVGVALGDIADGASGQLAVSEVFTLPKLAAGAIAQGASVYLSAAGEISTTNTDTPAGKAFAAAADGATTIQVLLNA